MLDRSKGCILTSVALEDFVKVFKVFESFPFFESWADDEIEGEYYSFCDIFGYYTDNGDCVSILTFKPYKADIHPLKFPNDAKVVYLSDVATLPKYRNRGLATHMFENGIRHFKVLGYDYIYLRTNEENSMSYNIACKLGFEMVPGVTQQVQMKRIDGTVQKDSRIFLVKKLSK